MKKIMRVFCLILATVLTFALPAAAGKGPEPLRYGPTVYGPIPREKTPIVVEKETITFDVQQLPLASYTDQAVFDEYGTSVTSEYIFRNPTDQIVTTQLLIPVMALPDYAEGLKIDLSHYQITVNGAPVQTQIRYSYYDQEKSFDLTQALAWMDFDWQDVYEDADAFDGLSYTDDTPVRKDTYQIHGLPEDEQRWAAVWYDVSCLDTLLYMDGGEAFLNEMPGLGVPVSKDDPFVDLYIIGKELASMKWTENDPPTTKELIATESMCFYDFLMKDYDPSYGIPEEDWYHAALAHLNESWFFTSFIKRGTELDMRDDLVTWVSYEITLTPGERMVSTVTVPIYPEDNSENYEGVYGYQYMQAPASRWGSVDELTLIIHTPFFLYHGVWGSNDSAIKLTDLFEQTDSGYTLTSTTLNGDRCTLYLSTELSMKHYNQNQPVAHPEQQLSFFEVLMLISAPIAGAVFVLRLAQRKK